MKEIKMPSLSPTMEKGTIVKWIKREGDEIKIGDIIAEIETDKASMEYESEESGRLGKIIKEEGEEIKVGEVIGIMLEEGESEEDIEGCEIKDNREKKDREKEKTTNSTSEVIENNNVSPVNLSIGYNKDRIIASPLAKVIAKLHNLELNDIKKGTGPNSRIVKADIISYLKNRATNSSTVENIPPHPGLKFKEDLSQSSYTEITNTSMRRTIAKRLLASKSTIPHYYLNLECIVEDLLKARVNINLKGKNKYKISINDFVIKAVGLAMRDVPEANSYWQGETSKQFSRQDVSVAVAIPNGLITPIVKDVANKGLVDISNEMKALVKKAKEGTLKPEEYQGGGFSISNLGMYGIDSFAAIINPPQSGILAVGKVQQKAIVSNGSIVASNVLSLVLSADHRVMDGALGATFLVKIKDYLENPASMLL